MASDRSWRGIGPRSSASAISTVPEAAITGKCSTHFVGLAATRTNASAVVAAACSSTRRRASSSGPLRPLPAATSSVTASVMRIGARCPHGVRPGPSRVW